jgi:hypothetical protein
VQLSKQIVLVREKLVFLEALANIVKQGALRLALIQQHAKHIQHQHDGGNTN